MYAKINAVPISIPIPILYGEPVNSDQRKKIASLISDYVTPALAQHLVSVECAMYELAGRYQDAANAERWALAGLLHDIDWDACQKNPDLHCKKGTQDWLVSAGINREIMEDALSHYGSVGGVGFPNGSGFVVNSKLREALFAADELCGFIIACALVRPSKSILDMEPSSVMKKFPRIRLPHNGFSRRQDAYCCRNFSSPREHAASSGRVFQCLCKGITPRFGREF